MKAILRQKQIEDRTKKSMKPLMQSSLVQKVNQQMRSRARKAGKIQDEPGIPVFWTSQTALLDLSRDDLAKLPREVHGIQDIYPNRVLSVPRTAEAKSLPQGILDNKTSAWGVHAIGALASWGAYLATGKDVTVAVLDTGVDADHPDLNGKVAGWGEFDRQGLPVPGSVAHDSGQHGTHVCGTIVGEGQSGQYIGVAPDARVAVALVLDGEIGGTDAQVLAGMDWAVTQAVDVISMSLGGLVLGPEAPSVYTAAIVTSLRAGIPVVAAIGNEGEQTSGTPGSDLFAFAVGATDHRDIPAAFSGGRTQIIHESSYIPEEYLPLPYSKPEVSAPGVGVKSCIPGGDYAIFNGTSMATPHVAGAMALILSGTDIRNSVFGADRAFLLQDLLTGSAEEMGEAGQDHRYGFGRIDVLRALGFAVELGY